MALMNTNIYKFKAYLFLYFNNIFLKNYFLLFFKKHRFSNFLLILLSSKNLTIQVNMQLFHPLIIPKIQKKNAFLYNPS